MSNKILVIGLGQIGFSNAKYISSLGLDVDGYDVNPQAVKKALEAKVIKKEALDFRDYDYYIICVSTHDLKDSSLPSLSALNQVVTKIELEGKKNSLVGIDSTIPYGTTKMIAKFLENKFHVVHVPHRYYSKEEKEHGVKQLRVMGADSECCKEAGKHFYNKILKIPLHYVRSSGIAEVTKITENTYRYIQIAFAEQLKLLCNKENLNFDELRNSVNTKWNVDILEARDGINGHCLPKDCEMFSEFCMKNSIPDISIAAKNIDSTYRKNIKLPIVGQ